MMLCIIKRDCIGMLRQRRSFVQLGVGLAISCLIFIFAWAALDKSHFVRPSDFGRTIFMPIAFFQLLFLLGLAGGAASSISGERERDTWETLTLTPIGSWRILLGKAASLLLYIFQMYIAILPVLALCFLLGGVSPREMIGTYIILFNAAVFVVMVGILFSCYMRSGVNAARAAILFLIFYTLLLPYLRIIFSSAYGKQIAYAPTIELLFSPLYSLIMLFNPRISRVAPEWMQLYPHWVFMIINCLICTVILIFAGNKIRRRESHKSINAKRSRKTAIEIGNTIEKFGIDDTQNPIWIKERGVKNPRFIRRPITQGFILFILAVLIGSFVAMADNRPSQNAFNIFGIAALFTLFITCILSPMAPAAAISGERDKKTWDLLRTTTLSAKQIVYGKCLSVLGRLLPIGYIWFVGLFGTIEIHRYIYNLQHTPQNGVKSRWNNVPLTWQDCDTHLVCFFLLLFSCVVLYACAGIYFSSHAKNMSKAQSKTFGFMILHGFGSIALMGIIGVMCYVIFSNDRSTKKIFEHQILPFLMNCSPFGLMIEGDRDFGPRSSNWPVVVNIYCFAMWGISALFLRAACRRIQETPE